MEKLEQLRKKAGYNFEQMANKVNISKTFYWQIEKEDRRLSYAMAVKIADVFNLKPDDIFYDHFKSKL